MIKGFAALLATASFVALATSAAAREAAQPDSVDPAVRAQEANQASTEAGVSDATIIVTARRRAESLQDVPQTVNAVTSEDIERLNLQDFEEIETIVPGLNLEAAGNGFSTTASIRGASFNVETGAKPTVVFYINEVPIESNILFSSMFDVGQIEVLRGPQGTLRGRSAPSGAITISTRRPDVSELGGMANMTLTSHDAINAQAALNVPIVRDVAAIRVSGIIDHSDGDGVRSVNNGRKPQLSTEAARISLRLTPTDSISATVMYQYMKRENRRYTQVTGTGARGGTVPSYTLGSLVYPSRPAPPAGYNGPPIAPGDRLAVGEEPLQINQEFQILTANVDWEFAGQKLSYVGGWSKQDTVGRGGGDAFNSYPGTVSQTLDNVSSYTSHELRLSSVERIGGFLDYTVGAFYNLEKTNVNTVQARFNPGAFGPIPLSPLVSQPLAQPDLAYVSRTHIRRQGKTEETSFFGTLTAHLGERTEITGGVRHIIWKEKPTGPFFPDPARTPAQLLGTGTTICFSSALARTPFPIAPITTPVGCIANAGETRNTKDTAWVWNLSASHEFSDDFMVYASAGTSWRAGPYSVFPGQLESPGFPSSNDLRLHDPERARAYELGFKSSFLDGRARFNVAAYYQTFKDYFFFSTNTYYLTFATTGAPQSVGTFDFTANANAKSYGVDVDAAFQITPNWDLSAAFSWAKGTIDDDEVPCNDSNFDGTPDGGVPTAAGFVAANVIVARCRTNVSISRSPRWNLSLRSEFTQPISDRMDAFLRGQFTYYPENPYRTQDLVIDNYGILNVFAGLRAPDNSWEINVFAKNLLKTQKIIDFDLNTIPHQVYGDPGYSTLTLTPRREFGINVRAAFGSR